MNQWDVYWADMPYEDDNTQSKIRPVIIINEQPTRVFVLRVTSHEARKADPYDYELIKWQTAGLSKPTTVRISKLALMEHNRLLDYIGHLAVVDINELRKLMKVYRKSISGEG